MSTTGNITLSPPCPAIIDLDQRYFSYPWSQEQWRQLDMETHSLFVWKDSEKIVGFALLQTLGGENTAHLYKILLIPEKRGNGTIQDFWSELAGQLRPQGYRDIYLEVEASNRRAIKFYQKTGFLLIKKNKGHYSSGEDGLMMKITL